MKLLFNKADNGAEELKNLTGSYYENNDFSKIKTDILLESEKIRDLVGSEVYQLAEDAYYESEPLEEPARDLMEHIQIPIAFLAAHKFYQGTILSHEDVGRKIKIDKESESMGWEWMYDRDDAANERKAFATIDRLIKFLDLSDLSQWKDSPSQKATRNLFVNSTKIFQATYPIDNSGRFYYTVVPFIAKIERQEIKKAIGSDRYTSLLAWHKNIENDGNDAPTPEDIDNSAVLALIRECVPLMVMAVAVRRLAINVLPEGVVQQFRSMMQTAKASQAATPELIRQFTLKMDVAAEKAFDELKKHIKSSDPTVGVYPLIPDNPPCQKVFRT